MGHGFERTRLERGSGGPFAGDVVFISQKKIRRARRVWRKLRRTFIVLLFGLTAAIAEEHIVHYYPMSEQKLIDYWFRARGTIAAPKDVLIVSMDDFSAQKLGVSAMVWPRALHVQLIERLKEFGANRVIFDVLFNEKREEADDLALAAAMKKLPVAIAKVRAVDIGQEGAGQDKPVILEPLGLFVEAAKAVVFVFAPSDPDGVVRRFQTAGGDVPGQVPLASALAGLLDGQELPTSYDLINYYGKPGTITILPYHTLLEGEEGELRALLKDKVVFVGKMFALEPAILSKQASTSYSDSFAIPTSDGTIGRRAFGVEIQATIAGNLLDGTWIRRAPPRTEILVLVVAALCFSMVLFMLRPIWEGVVTLLAGAAVWGFLSYRAFLSGYFLPGMSLFVFLLPVCLLASTLYYYWVTRQSFRAVQSGLGINISEPT